MVLTAEDRFWAKVDKSGGPDACWLWTACLHRDGYGHFKVAGVTKRAHRLAYQLLVGSVPDGLTLDHLCRNRSCVNPAHMEPVTIGENVLRGEGSSAQRARQIECKRGHPLNGRNLIVKKGGHRQCRECRNWTRRRSRAPHNNLESFRWC